MKKSFILYNDNAVMFFTGSENEAGKLIRAVFNYHNGEDIGKLPEPAKSLFQVLRAQFERDNEKWKQTSKNRSKAGTAGATARWQGMANDGICQQMMAKMADSVNVNDNVNVNTKKAETLFELPNNNQLLRYNQWTEAQFLQSIEAAIANKPDYETIKDDFFKYWTEPNPKGKLKFSIEKTWDTGRRLDNWYQRSPPTKSTDTPESKFQQMMQERNKEW